MASKNPLNTDFGAEVERLLKKFKVPSLSIAIVDNDNVHTAAYNNSEAKLDLATVPETLFYTGSTTKSFVAAALTLLADDGLLKLSDPLNKHLPKLKLWSAKATLETTIEDALSHRSGMPSHNNAYGGERYTIDDLYNALPHLQFTAEPRTKYQYSNIMYMLTSHVVEVVSGQSLEEFVRARILEPLEMTSTYLSLANAQRATDSDGKHLASALFWNVDQQAFRRESWMDCSIIGGAAHMISNVLDFAKYLKALINESPPLSKEGHKELRTPRSFDDPPEHGGPYVGPRAYTLGWVFTVYAGEEIFFHGGGVPGFGALMCYIPRIKWGVAMMGNTEVRSNLLEDILWHRLMNERLAVPMDRQFDFETFWEKKHNKDYEENYHNSVSRLYPDVTRIGLPSSVSWPNAFAGSFAHPGYGTFDLKLKSPRDRYPGAEEGAILCTDTANRPWQFQMQFQHISHLHFLAWKLPLEDNPALLFKGATKAEFHIDPRGNVDMLGLLLEEAMGEEKIWFKRKQSEANSQPPKND